MTSSALRNLASDKFYDHVGFILPPVPMRLALLRNPAVKEVERSLKFGQVSADEIRRFVSDLMAEFRSGEVFRHDLALAALAVAMEHWNHGFAEEYLIDLARVQRSEFRCSYRVAGECLKVRHAFPRTRIKSARYSVRGISIVATGTMRAMSSSAASRWHGDFGWIRYSEMINAST